jgi:hypothetical protein
MPKPGQHKTVQAHILAYAQEGERGRAGEGETGRGRRGDEQRRFIHVIGGQSSA